MDIWDSTSIPPLTIIRPQNMQLRQAAWKYVPVCATGLSVTKARAMGPHCKAQTPGTTLPAQPRGLLQGRTHAGILQGVSEVIQRSGS